MIYLSRLYALIGQKDNFELSVGWIKSSGSTEHLNLCGSSLHVTIHFALDFSVKNNIVESDEWANLIEENGLDGAPVGHPGHKFTEEQRKTISSASKSRWQDPEFKSRVAQKQKESWTDERKQAQSMRLSGIKRPDHSEMMKGRPMPDDHPWKSGEAKSESHKKKISESLQGRPKSEEHKLKLKAPKPLVVCRIHDRKLMALGNFMKWYNLQLRSDEISV